MAATDFHFDTRIRRVHVPLLTQQHRIRHLRSLAARNIMLDNQKNITNVCLFYSLHLKPDSQAFYTSETVSDNLNPTWKDFEPSNFPDTTNTALPYIVIKVWNDDNVQKQLIVEWVVFFSGLCFLGKQIPKEGKTFKPNSLIFGMVEGYYGCQNCHQHTVPSESELARKESIPADLTALRTSCALSTLERIKTIECAIKQTQASAAKRRRNIENKLQGVERLHNIHGERELLKIKTSMLEQEVKLQRSNLIELQKLCDSRQDVLNSKRADLANKYEELRKLKDRLVEMGRYYCEFRENLLKAEAKLTFRRKELLSDLFAIYPIVEFPDHSGYSIHNVYLPNSEYILGHDETMISVALGYVCHMVLMLSQLANTPLRYAIHFGGSRSTIIDHVTCTIPVKNREFPLFSKGRDKRFFEYGVYLLNKDIAQLRILFGLLTKELSATLPNLHSLFTLRLSIPSEPYFVPKPVLSRTSSDESSKLLPEKSLQNGLTHVSGKGDTISPETSITSCEIEHLRKEMAEMVPSAVSDKNNIFPCKANEISSTFSCSLDKGLNDIKALENSLKHDLKHSQKPTKLIIQKDKVNQGTHHASYPNLNSSVHAHENGSITMQPQGSPQPQTTPLKMWIGSQNNSEEESFEESLKLNQESKSILKDTCFYMPSKEWEAILQNSDIVSVNTDPKLELEKVLLADKDFTDDLTLRTEQLASRSSSFQMQRMNSTSEAE